MLDDALGFHTSWIYHCIQDFTALRSNNLVCFCSLGQHTASTDVVGLGLFHTVQGPIRQKSFMSPTSD